MKISDKIEAFITALIKEEQENSWVELRRNELASFFDCVPSQINYVISTRFTPEQGYIVESRRGGGGYLKIRKIKPENESYLSYALKSIPEYIDYQSARGYIASLLQTGELSNKDAMLILSAVADTVLTVPQPHKDRIRANILKNTLAILISEER